jgi:RNA polymerase sigma-70 factor (ECF subfamily)
MRRRCATTAGSLDQCLLIRRVDEKGYAWRRLVVPTMTTPESSVDALGELMRAAQQGDERAYLELLRTVTPRVRQLVQRQRGFAGAAEVEDLVQDVLLSVHAVRATYDPNRPFTPWLLAIVRHRLVDGARRYARIARREIQVVDLDVTLLEAETNEEIVEVGDAAALHEAVRALPEGQRQAIELLKLKELSLKDAAVVSGTSVGALKVATHRAMAALKLTLGKRRG